MKGIKGLIIVCCVFFLTGCSEDDAILKPIKDRQLLSEHLHRTIKVQKSKSRAREDKLDAIIGKNR